VVRLGGDGVTAAIVAEMKQASSPTQVALIEILTTRRALDAISDLLSAAVGADAAVRAAAMAALGQLAGPEHLAGMVQGVLKAEKGAEREAAEKSIVAVCGRIADAEKRADPLLAVRESLNAADRTTLLPTLGRLGGNKSLELVETAIADADPHLRDVGLRALCNWPQPSVAPRLVELFEKEENPAQRAMLLAAFIRVAPLGDKRSSAEKLAGLQKAMSLCSRPEERQSVLKRARAVRSVESLRFVAAYLDDPQYAEQACETIVELAHHRELREANKAEFEKALDRVIETSHDATVLERADRYKHGKTWARPTVAE
jgi:HEAT repeat protein